MRAHGTVGVWRDGCTCGPCVFVGARYLMRRAGRGHYTGQEPELVDARPARLRLRALQDAGWTVRRVADATGIAKSQVARIRSGEADRVRRETAIAVMERTPAPASVG